MLKIKANCMSAPVNAVVAAEEDLLGATEECCAIYQDMVSAGIECSEIVDVINDVMLVRDVVKQHGVRAYYYQFDKENKFAANFNVRPYEPGLGLSAMSDMDSEYVTAAEEGLKVWWTKFIEALKTLWTKFVNWCQQVLTFRNHYLNKLKKLYEDFKFIDEEKTLDVMSLDNAKKCLKAAMCIHDEIKNNSSLLANFDVNKDKLKDPKSTLIDALKDIGYELKVGDEKILTLDQDADGLTTKCPTEKKTLKDHKWSTITFKTFMKDLLGIESREEFRRNAKTVQDGIKRVFDTVGQVADSVAEKNNIDSKVKTSADVLLIRQKNSAIRTTVKLVTLENKLMVRCLKTAMKLVEAKKEEKK